MKNLRVARRYAAALMSAAEQRGTMQAVSAELEAIGKLLQDSREFSLLVGSPVISAARKISVFRELFESRVGVEVMSFLVLLAEKGREEVLPEIIEQFQSLVRDRLGVVQVEVTSAVDLTDEQEQMLRRRLEAYTKKKVRMTVGLDKEIQGGLLIQIGDTILDGSLQHQLEVLRERFVKGGIHH
jgi:F-type H+-transporting ATPase subunit delta